MDKKRVFNKQTGKIILLLVLILVMALVVALALGQILNRRSSTVITENSQEDSGLEAVILESEYFGSEDLETIVIETEESELYSVELEASEFGETEAETSEPNAGTETENGEPGSSESEHIESETGESDGSGNNGGSGSSGGSSGSSESDTSAETTSETGSGESSSESSSQSSNTGSGGTVEEQAQAIMASMTLEEQIYQMFIVAPEQLTGVSVQTQAGSTTQAALEKYPVGGIVFFAANLQTRSQVSTMISNMQSYSEIGLFIAVDEEGGTVARIGNNSSLGTTSFPNMKTIGNSGDTSKAYHVGYTIGSEIAQLGFNLDFAPVADVDSNPDNPVIGNRAFSSDASVAASMVSAAVKGFRDSGTLCTLKHFPGHGDTATDSHAGYTELDKSLDELWEVEFVPFQSGISAGADFVMVGHISVPQVTGNDVPASLSGTMIGILRDDLGFNGLVITDSMQMEAITDRYTSGEAAVKAIQAGVDIILMPADLQAAVAGVKAAVKAGTISEERIEESVLRILEAKIEAGIE